MKTPYIVIRNLYFILTGGFMKKVIIISAVILILGGGGAAYWFFGGKVEVKSAEVKIVSPEKGKIDVMISSTGSVIPNNRVEIKPTVDGRVDSLLVEEGDKVKTGQILAWMSSSERAILLDAARSQGAAAIKHWEDVYKQTPLIAQIDGEVIVRNIDPGQSVSQSTTVLVLSDRLVVDAKVDETDIGKVKPGQDARISLDAYPDIKEMGTVSRISYESRLVNNVTTYDVIITLKKIPSVFRSGMSATVNIIQERKKDILILPVAAIKKEGKETFVMLKKEGVLEPVKTKVETGITDMTNIEIVSGAGPEDKVIVEGKKFKISDKNPAGASPFMPTAPAAGGRGR